MAPIVHGLEVDFYEKIRFSFLDIDDPDNKTIMRELGFRVQPEFYLVDEEGNVLQKWIGPVTKDQFEQVFNDYLNE